MRQEAQEIKWASSLFNFYFKLSSSQAVRTLSGILYRNFAMRWPWGNGKEPESSVQFQEEGGTDKRDRSRGLRVTSLEPREIREPGSDKKTLCCQDITMTNWQLKGGHF